MYKQCVAASLLVVFAAGCSTTSQERVSSGLQAGTAMSAIGHVPGVGVVAFTSVLYDFLREKPVFKRTEGMNAVILKRIPGFPGFYKRALDKFKSGALIEEDGQKSANEAAYAAGKTLYLRYSEGGEKEVVFAFSKTSDVVKIMTPAEAGAEKAAKGN